MTEPGYTYRAIVRSVYDGANINDAIVVSGHAAYREY